MDLIVRTSAEVRRRIQMGDQFLREVTSKGIVLHESRHARMGCRNNTQRCQDAADRLARTRRDAEVAIATVRRRTGQSHFAPLIG